MSAIAPAGRPTAPSADRVIISLAGSGFRAALFQLGALRRLNELGLLSEARAIHAVSGGSIVLGMMAARWPYLEVDGRGRILEFEHYVADPVERFVSRQLNLRPSMSTRMRPRNWRKLLSGQFSETDRLVEYIEERLVGRKRLADLQDHDMDFRWHATNLRTGGRWEFSPTRVGEALLGYRWPDRTTVAEVVASSVIEPSTLSPMVFRSDPAMFEGGSGDESAVALREVALLTDGSMHDPLGIDSTVGQCGMLIVCDGGSMVMPAADYSDWTGNRLLRSLHIQQYRGVELRRRWFVEAIRKGQIEGTYIGLAAHHTDYGLPDSMGYSMRVAEQIWHLPGGLGCIEKEAVSLISNHGYTIADAAVRRLLAHRLKYNPSLRLPFPDAGDEQTMSIRIERSSLDHNVRRSA